MPIYEFICTACNELFELLVMSAKGIVQPPCPKCGSEKKVEKKLSTVFTRPHGIPSGSGGFKAPKCTPRATGGG